MNLQRIAQVAAARAALDVGGLDDFVRAFSDALGGWCVLGVPSSFDALAVTTRLQGPRLDAFLLERDVALADALHHLAPQPVELTLASGGALTARFVGTWSRRKAWRALPELGIGQEARVAWDEALGAARTSEVLSVAVGQRCEVEVGQRFRGAEAPAMAAQLGLLTERIGLDAPWLPGLYERLCARDLNTTPWTLRLAPDRLLPEVRVTIPFVPVPIVLKVLGQVGAPDGHPAKLGALMAALGIDDDVVWRLHLDARAGEPASASLELRAP